MDVRARPQAPQPAAEADPHQPISPPEAVGKGVFALPAYVSNGLIGLRILGAPLQGGLAMLNGFVGEHPEKRVEASARAPFPLGGDLVLDGVRLSHTPYLLEQPRQTYDFATGELTTRAAFRTAKTRAEIETVIFCSRRRPTLACQEIRLTVDAACRVQLSAGVDARGVYGREVQILVDGKLLEEAGVDGALRGRATATSRVAAWLSPPSCWKRRARSRPWNGASSSCSPSMLSTPSPAACTGSAR